jgi:hypothetical protein
MNKRMQLHDTLYMDPPVKPEDKQKNKDGKEGTSEYGYSFEKRGESQDLTISPIPTSKDKIKQPPLAAHEDMYIPPMGHQWSLYFL